MYANNKEGVTTIGLIISILIIVMFVTILKETYFVTDKVENNEIDNTEVVTVEENIISE